jgi:hypothetical protein
MRPLGRAKTSGVAVVMTPSPLWQAREKGNLMASIMDIASVEQAITWQADHATRTAPRPPAAWCAQRRC